VAPGAATEGLSASELTKLLPPIATIPPGRVKHDKMWLADTGKFRRDKPFKSSEWLADVATTIDRNRQKGDPSAASIYAFAKQLAQEADHNNEGCVNNVSLRFLGYLLRRCKELARQVIRWLELYGVIFTRGTRVRIDSEAWKGERNGPNCYVLQMLDDIPPDPVEDDEVVLAEVQVDPPPDASVIRAITVMERMTRAAERWAPCFGLVARATGWLNRTPERRGRDPHPA